MTDPLNTYRGFLASAQEAAAMFPPNHRNTNWKVFQWRIAAASALLASALSTAPLPMDALTVDLDHLRKGIDEAAQTLFTPTAGNVVSTEPDAPPKGHP